MKARQPAGPLPIKEEEISDSVTHLLEEGRMLIPGVQALFGFQLVIVFSQPFGSLLSSSEKAWHLVAIACSVVTIVLLFTPAMVHRQRESGWATQGFVNASSKLMTAASFPLSLGLAIDFALVARVITQDALIALAFAIATLALIAFFWHILPRTDPLLVKLRR